MTVELQIEVIVQLFTNSLFLLSALIATWGVMGFRWLRRRDHGPSTGPTHATGTVNFPLKPKLSEEEIFRILTTNEVNIQIVRICETAKTAREISKGLGDIYPDQDFRIGKYRTFMRDQSASIEIGSQNANRG